MTSYMILILPSHKLDISINNCIDEDALIISPL